LDKAVHLCTLQLTTQSEQPLPPPCPAGSAWVIEVLQSIPPCAGCVVAGSSVEPRDPTPLTCTPGLGWPSQSLEMVPIPVRGGGSSGCILPCTHPPWGLDEDASVDLTLGLTASPLPEPTWQKKRNGQEKPPSGRWNPSPEQPGRPAAPGCGCCRHRSPITTITPRARPRAWLPRGDAGRTMGGSRGQVFFSPRPAFLVCGVSTWEARLAPRSPAPR